MKKNMLLSIVIILLTSQMYGQEKTEDMFSSSADRADVLIKIAAIDAPPFKLTKAEKEQFNQIVELIRADKPLKALEKWEKFKDLLGKRGSAPGAEGDMINFLLRKALLETDKTLLQRVEEIANLDTDQEDEKEKYDSLYSELTESMKVKNTQYDLVTRIMRFYNKIFKF